MNNEELTVEELISCETVENMFVDDEAVTKELSILDDEVELTVDTVVTAIATVEEVIDKVLVESETFDVTR